MIIPLRLWQLRLLPDHRTCGTVILTQQLAFLIVDEHGLGRAHGFHHTLAQGIVFIRRRGTARDTSLLHHIAVAVGKRHPTRATAIIRQRVAVITIGERTRDAPGDNILMLLITVRFKIGLSG